MSKTLDEITMKRRGYDPATEQPSAEEASRIRREAEDKAFESSATKAERKAASERFSKIKRALLSIVSTSMPHGKVISASEQRAIVDRIVAGLGGNLPQKVRDAVASMVKDAAGLTREGLAGQAWQKAEDVAADLADIDFDIESRAADDLPDDPESLAARIPRG